MSQKKITFIFSTIGILLVVGSVYLMTASPVKAQCGSQASSCKNCHETQAQDPVNNDGTAWHTQHAFGDFCYLCHAGNNQAADKATAHTGMVAPLSDIATNCKVCHVKDYQALAQVYATTLGVAIGSGAVPTSATAAPAASATVAPATSVPASGEAAVIPADTALNVDDPNAVNYAQNYDEIVLGKKPANWGNIILITILVMIVLGGGFFVLKREGLINISFDDPRRVSVQEKYPADVVGMLPGISRLKPASRQILHKILANPKAATDLLTSIDKLTHEDPAGDQAAED
jgi:hypothetical protein